MMTDSEHLIGGLESAGYRLEVLGESVSVEAREVRQKAGELRALLSEYRSQGREFEDDAAYEAAINKLHGTVETDLRHQVEVIRDVLRNL